MKIKLCTNSHTRRAEQGYTLVEVVMGSVVMLIMGIGLFGGMTSATGFTQLARQDLRATQIMLEKMEEIRLYSWSQVNSNGYIPTNFTTSYYPAGMSSNAGGITYTGQLSILPINYTGLSYSNAMRQVQVNLQWKCGKVVRYRTMYTYVASNGIQNYVYNGAP
jgi:type II secretory pathway pseudopilin PulG